MKTKNAIRIIILTLGILCLCPVSVIHAQTTITKTDKKRGQGNGDQLGNKKNKKEEKKKRRNANTDEQLGKSEQPSKVSDFNSSYSIQQGKSGLRPKGSPYGNDISGKVTEGTEKSQSDSLLVKNVKNDKPVYYAHVTKKNGWFVGIGKPLTLEQAGHLNCYFKLSRKNDAGNWTFVEAFDGYGDPAVSDLVPYLVNPYDDDDKGANAEWKETLKTVCKWAFQADATGKTVVQEIAMGTDSSAVFIFHPVKVGESEYMGFYTDKWGMPIYLRTDESGEHENCASRVLITRDKRGFDVLIKYIDDKECPQKNGDGAFMTQYEYEDDGNQKSCLSLNILGQRMIDDCGNCGWVRTFKNGLKEEVFYVDAEGNYMRMPGLRENSETIYGYRMFYDQFGRDTTILFIDAYGQPDVNDNGVHKTHKVYNSHGQIIEQAWYDLNSQLCPVNDSGLSQMFTKYNAHGIMRQQEFKDKDNRYVTGNGEYCKRIDEYKDEQLIHSIEYVPEESGDSLVKSFEYVMDDKGNARRTWFVGGYQRIDSVDSKGRNTLIAWYDLDGNAYQCEDDYHKVITTYDDEKGIETEEWFDTDGDPCPDNSGEFTSSMTRTDTINHIITNDQYVYSFMKCAFQKIYDPVSGKTIQQYDLTPYGEHARVGWWDNLHYISNVDHHLNGETKTISGENEFGEPSYLRSLGENHEVYYIYDVQGGRYYDENCQEISSYAMDYFIQELPRAYCIEITDTAAAAYNLGLRNGDIIVSYGDWTTSDDLNIDMDDFYLETILKVHSPKNITLLRHHPNEKSSEIVKLLLPSGKVSDLGFYPHKIYYTQKEKERLIQTCTAKGISLTPPVIERDTTIFMTVQQKGSLLDTRFYHLSQNQDAGILLYAKTDGDVWSIRKGISPELEEDGSDAFSSYFSERKVVLTHDLSGLCNLTCDNSSTYGLEIIPIKVSRSFFDRIQNFYASNSDDMPSDLSLEEYRAMNDPTITDKKLMGKWNMMAQLTDEVDAELTLKLDKSKKATLTLKLNLNYELFQLEYLCNLTPQWSLNGVCLELDFTNANADCQLTKLEYQIEEDEAVALLQNAAEDFRQQLIDNFSLQKIFNEEYLIVKEVTKTHMKVLDGETERVFTKIM